MLAFTVIMMMVVLWLLSLEWTHAYSILHVYFMGFGFGGGVFGMGSWVGSHPVSIQRQLVMNNSKCDVCACVGAWFVVAELLGSKAVIH